MKPVYFPFTFIDKITACRAAALWPGLRVYLPSEMPLPEAMRLQVDKGLIEPIVPVEEDSRAVEAIYKAYCQWKEATTGADVSFLKIPEEGGIPFFDEAAVSYLRDTIVRYEPGAGDVSARLAGKAMDKGLPPDMAARVFLRITADYDAQATAVSETIDTLADKERAMFEALKGNDEALFGKGRKPGVPGMGSNEEPNTGDDPGLMMTGARVRAWARLAALAPDQGGLCLTNSRAVFDYIIDRVDTDNRGKLLFIGDRLADCDATAQADPVVGHWCRSFSSGIANLCTAGDVEEAVSDMPDAPPAGIDAAGMAISVYVMPDTPLPVFLSNCAGEPLKTGGMPEQRAGKNIVVICLT
ncbi:MAG: hypothetical protein SWH68_13535 [Thermodesulfobacteriota bacterium]|nr:hypothetical protein [Thermodesulfobacteriota bacterium]